MFFHRHRLPDDTPRTDPENASVDIMDKHFQQECAWAMGYVTLLERHLNDLKNRCGKCPYCNQKDSGCYEERNT